MTENCIKMTGNLLQTLLFLRETTPKITHKLIETVAVVGSGNNSTSKVVNNLSTSILW